MNKRINLCVRTRISNRINVMNVDKRSTAGVSRKILKQLISSSTDMDGIEWSFEQDIVSIPGTDLQAAMVAQLCNNTR